MTLRVVPLVAASAIGCSLLIPLDYTGGTGAAGTPGSGASSGTGFGASGGVLFTGGTTGGTTPFGGSTNAGGSGGTSEGGQPEGGIGNEAGMGGSTGGGTGEGGSSTSGDAGEGASGGTDTTGGVGGTGATGGVAGASAGGVSGGGMGGGGTGAAGRAGRGGQGGAGMSGMAGMGGASCQFDTTNDPDHCGSCMNACPSGVECIESKCITSPCVGICSSPATIMHGNQNDGYRAENLGTGEICLETVTYATEVAETNPTGKPSIVTWEFLSGRPIDVNGVSIPSINGDPGAALNMPLRGGGFCIHAAAGQSTSAGIKLPVPAELH